MSLHPASWLEAAQALPEGGKKRTTHDCGPGKVLTVDNKPEGWGAWCHRCNEAGWVPRPQESLTQRLDRLRNMRGRDTVGVTFGYPTYRRNYNIETWPKEARVWLYKAGISNARIRELGWFYHNDSERVVLVVYDENNNEIYWQARSFDPERPKYINPQGTKAIFKHGSASRICITEDILSAVRVGESGIAEGWCIMGTSLTEKALLAILRAAKDVDIWLDPDAAGIKGARKFLPKLLSAGLTVRVLKSDRDPKLHSREEILAVLRCDTSAPS